jgi:hypothetical protein
MLRSVDGDAFARGPVGAARHQKHRENIGEWVGAVRKNPGSKINVGPKERTGPPDQMRDRASESDACKPLILFGLTTRPHATSTRVAPILPAFQSEQDVFGKTDGRNGPQLFPHYGSDLEAAKAAGRKRPGGLRGDFG